MALSEHASEKISVFADIGVPEADEMFGQEETAQLLALVQGGEVSAAELAAKLHIVVAERRNYDPAATRDALIELAPTRTLIVPRSWNT